MSKDIPIKITVQTSDVTKAAKKAEHEMDKLERKAKTSGDKIGSNLSTGFSKFKSSIVAIGAASIAGVGIAALAKSVLDVNRKFESLTMQLKTFLGDAKKAKEAFAAINAFAAPLPMTVTEATNAVIKMTALGLQPSERALMSFGDIAAGTGKNLMQFVEAVADAATNEFERLKEFGIKARQQQDTVAFTFAGVTTVVKKNADAITEYLTQLGENKFGGSMANQAQTVNGALSVLGSAWDNFADKLLNDKSMSYIAKSITWLADKLTDFGNGLVTIPNYWALMWQKMELAFYKFYQNIAPMVDLFFKMIGKKAIDGGTQVENVAARIADVQKRMAANAKDALAKIGGSTKKIEDFFQKSGGAASAQKDSAAAAKEATAQLAAQDRILQLLNPATASFDLQLRQLKKDADAGYISQTQYNAGLKELNRLREEAANQQKVDDQSMINNIIDPDQANFADQMAEIEAALSRGTISIDQYAAATTKLKDERQKLLDQKAEDALASSTQWVDGATRGLNELVKNYEDSASKIQGVITDAFKGAEDALVEFCKTGKLDFTDLADTILDQILRMAIQQQILAPFANMLNGATSGTDTSSGVGGMLSGLAGLFGFASGGSFKVSRATSVGDAKGTDNRIVAFRARDGETVNVNRNGTAGSGRGGVTMNVYTKDADSFNRSESQILSRASSLMGRAAARNN